MKDLHSAFQALASELIARKLLGTGYPIQSMHLHLSGGTVVSLEPAPGSDPEKVEAVKMLAEQWEWPSPVAVRVD